MHTPNEAAGTLPHPARSFEPLTADELLRLTYFKLTYLAQAHLERAGLPADPEAARHLAFGRWLHRSGRLNREFRASVDG